VLSTARAFGFAGIVLLLVGVGVSAFARDKDADQERQRDPEPRDRTARSDVEQRSSQVDRTQTANDRAERQQERASANDRSERQQERAASANDRSERGQNTSASADRSTRTHATQNQPTDDATRHGGHPPRTPVDGIAHYGHDHSLGGGSGGGAFCVAWYPWWGADYDWGWDSPYYGYESYVELPYAYDDGGGEYGDEVSPDEPASIETHVSPSKAEVLLDGESMGYASDYNGRWDELRVPPGRHTLSFVLKDFKTLVVEIDALPGAEYELREKLARGDGEVHRGVTQATVLKDESAGLRIEVTPEDAVIYLDGQYLGLARELGQMHGALKIDAGPHQLEAVLSGYGSEVRTIGVEPGLVGSVRFELAAQP
jgi:hypothetical protein